MSGLQERLREVARLAEMVGAVAGISVAGQRDLAAVGYADLATGRAMTPETPVHIASLTKPVVATAAMAAFRRHRIGLDEPLADLMPQLSPAWRASRWVTLRQVLSHTSGLRPDLPERERALADAAADPVREAVERTVAAAQVFRPGAAWQYCNAGFGLAGYALGLLAGTSFERALGDELLRPYGMSYTAFDAGSLVACGHSPRGAIRERYWRCRRPGGGLISTVGDLLTFAERLFDEVDTLAETGRAIAPTLLGSSYALGWNVSYGGRVRWHSGDWGGFHAQLLLHPQRLFAAAIVVNDDAGARARNGFGWNELRSVSGLRRPRLTPPLLFAHAGIRVVTARLRRGRVQPAIR